MSQNHATGISDESGSRAGLREWIGLAVLALPVVLLALDNSVLLLALPHLAADLAPSSTQLLWIMDFYGFMIAGFLVMMGTLGDRIGRRRLLLIGAGAFGLASIAAAYSTSAEMLVATRALLGVAAATMMPSTLALLSNMFKDPKQRAFAIGVWMASFSGGAIVGPIVGGVLLEWFWWGSVFLAGVPVMVLLLATAPAVLPEYRDPGAGRLDLTSVVLSLGAILPVIYGLKEVAKQGVEVLPVLAVAAGLIVGIAFVRRQRGQADPLLDLSLFANRSFRAALGILVLGMAAMAGMYYFVTQYMQLVEGSSPLRAGLWLMPAVLGEMAMVTLAPVIARRVRPAYVVGAGLILAATGALVITQVDAASGVGLLMTGFVVLLLGTAPMMALGVVLVVGSAPPENAGTAAAMPETGGEFGVAMGFATLGSLGTMVYRNQIADTLPADLPPEAAEAAGDTLAGAVTAADQLPTALAAQLLGTAREAFTSGLNVTAAVTAVLMVGLAALAVILLRHVPPIGDETPDDPSDNQVAVPVGDTPRHSSDHVAMP